MVLETGVVSFVVGIPVSCDSHTFIPGKGKTYGSVLDSPRHENSLSNAHYPMLKALNLDDKTELLERYLIPFLFN